MTDSTQDDVSICIPLKIENDDRLRNSIALITYLLKHTSAKILVKEVSPRNVFGTRAIKAIAKITDTNNLTAFYEHTDEPYFNFAKVTNDLILAADTSVIAICSNDIILPVSSYKPALDMIQNDQCDIVYPSNLNYYMWESKFSPDIFYKFIQAEVPTNILDQNRNLQYFGKWCGITYMKKQKYIDCYMLNENFYGWGHEDDEFDFRMQMLGCRIGMVDDAVYHLQHTRTDDSIAGHPIQKQNRILWDEIKQFDKQKLIAYYEGQTYIQTRRAQLK
jgi:hypothetical protein